MPTTLSVDENSPAGTLAGEIGVFAHGHSPITLFAISGTNSDWFKADKNGRVTLTEKAKLDYESKNSFALKVKAASGYGESAIVDLTINVNNAPDTPPVVKSAYFYYVDENSPAGTFVGQLTINDDGSPIISAGLSGTGAEHFRVDNSGTIFVAEGAKLDYESKSGYIVYAKAANAFGESNAASVQIGLNNLVDNPPVLQNTHFSINRKTPVNKTIGNVRVGSTIHCDITGYKLDNESVFGVRANGEVYTKAAVTEGSSYAMNVSAKSLCGDSATIALTVDTQNRVIGRFMEIFGNRVESYWSVALSPDGSKTFVATDYGLRIIDISDPFSPAFIGQIKIDKANDVVISSNGEKAFVTDSWERELKIIDVSDPANPKLDGWIAVGYYPSSVVLSSDNAKAFVAGDYGLRIIDVNNTAEPKLIGETGRLGTYSANDVALSSDETKAFVAHAYDGLKIVDVSDPKNPKLDVNISTAHAMAVALSSDETKAFVADSSFLRTIDVRDTKNPVIDGLIGAYGARDVALSSNNKKAFVACYDAQSLMIFDVNNTAAPKLDAQISVSEALSVVISQDDAMAFVTYHGGLQIIDIEDFTKD
jgi:hypothetical protein